MTYSTTQTAELLTVCRDEMREWAATASYEAAARHRMGDHIGATWHESRALRAASCAAELHILIGDAQALLDVRAAGQQYLEAVDALRRRHQRQTSRWRDALAG